jgi:uncharacterized protein YgfB (UPF0149 family)
MADGPTRARAGAFWGSILAGARAGATTAQLWQAIRDEATREGVALPSDVFQQVNRMRHLATGLRRSSDHLGRAGPADAITAADIGQQVYARGPLQQQLAPRFHIRFELTTRVAGVEETGWYNMLYDGPLEGTTVAELMDELDAFAEGLSESYTREYVARGRVEIGAY